MEYLEDLWETFIEQPIKILCTALLIWAILPVILFAIGGVGLLLQIINLDSFTNLFSNAIIDWGVSIIMNLKKFILEYLILTILTLILVNHDIIEPIGLRDLIEILKPKT